MIYLDTGPSERGAHRVMTAAKCLRHYALDIQQKAGPAQPPKRGATLMGSMLHLMLAHRYALKAFRDGATTLSAADRTLTRADVPDILNPYDALDEFVFVRDPSGTAEEYHAQCIALYKAYDAKYGAESNWTVLGVEHQYRMTLPGLPPELSLYTQRADLIVRDNKTKLVYIVDHKKAYEISTKTLAQYALHGQFLGYARIGKREYGQSFGGCIVNRIAPDKAGPKFSRTPIDPAPMAVNQYVRNVVAIEKMIAMTEKEYGPPLITGAAWPAAFSEEVCYGKYGKCRHFDTCRFGVPSPA